MLILKRLILLEKRDYIPLMIAEELIGFLHAPEGIVAEIAAGRTWAKALQIKRPAVVDLFWRLDILGLLRTHSFINLFL